MRSRALRVSLLLFGSGLTALVYQIAWMRELRLIFGFSTAASAAVVAIFMGGLGIGSVFLGRRADQTARPLAFYGARPRRKEVSDFPPGRTRRRARAERAGQ